MPGVLQMITCVQLRQQDDLFTAFARYAELLREIGYSSSLLNDSSFADLTWESLEEFGFGRSFDADAIRIGNIYLNVAPALLAFAGERIGADTHWLEMLLYFDIEDLTFSPNDDHYRPEIASGIWHMMQVWSNYFQETGVYLTDEVDDGKTWLTLASKDESRTDMWAFDLALIPSHLASYFSPVPKVHKKEFFEYGMGLARSDRWPLLPWEA